ncbi:hypothetical protein ANCDUO_08254 [Ancylostoma duodenale]|uniref:Uncharacterized protein n=1 Tax=Ancylostoma duodenale TaxID=51022 RepID=A0A0C2CWX6_9BILA|nr:hypothetical protein ANCDUO_08254 [Ancylostoma duodenale]
MHTKHIQLLPEQIGMAIRQLAGDLVYDVNYVNLLGRTFANSQDHSKWGVSMNPAVPAVCIGDVNRQESQYRRGGGAVCIMDPKLWRTFYYSVTEYEECPPFSGVQREMLNKAVSRLYEVNKLNHIENLLLPQTQFEGQDDGVIRKV